MTPSSVQYYNDLTSYLIIFLIICVSQELLIIQYDRIY